MVCRASHERMLTFLTYYCCITHPEQAADSMRIKKYAAIITWCVTRGMYTPGTHHVCMCIYTYRYYLPLNAVVCIPLNSLAYC